MCLSLKFRNGNLNYIFKTVQNSRNNYTTQCTVQTTVHFRAAAMHSLHVRQLSLQFFSEIGYYPTPTMRETRQHRSGWRELLIVMTNIAANICCMYFNCIFNHTLQLLSVSQRMQPLLHLCILLFCLTFTRHLMFHIVYNTQQLRFVSCLINQ